MPRKIYSSTELQIMRDGQHLLGGSYYGSNLGKDVFNKIGGSEYNTGDWTCVVFKASSTKSQYITFNTQINNINVLVVAGGGAGSSSPGGPSPTQGGGGGGGGGIFYSNSFPITIGKQFSINVGVGGVNLNSPNGGISSVSLDGTNIITATAGAGGGSTQSGGGGGLGSSTYSSTGGYPGGTGADGYDAAQWATFGPLPNGKSSGLVSITIPIETTTQNGTTSSTTNLYLSGGGGGACQYNPGGMYGGAGSGNGGISYNPDLSPPPNPSFRDACGKNSFKNNEGFGGGGGGTYAIGSPTILGGSGGAGVVIFWWKN
jgi:hypothetical protein